MLGKGGAQIKRIGAAARAELEKLLERRVHLFLHVRVSEDWADDRERYEAMGLIRVTGGAECAGATRRSCWRPAAMARARCSCIC